MGISEQVQKDMVEAMRSREELRLSTLRMMKSALKNKEIEKRAPLDDKEAQQVLATMIKQRRDSIEQFQKGGRPELAQKDARLTRKFDQVVQVCRGHPEERCAGP